MTYESAPHWPLSVWWLRWQVDGAKSISLKGELLCPILVKCLVGERRKYTKLKDILWSFLGAVCGSKFSMLFLDHWYLVGHITQVIWYIPEKENISKIRAILSSPSTEKDSAHNLKTPWVVGLLRLTQGKVRLGTIRTVSTITECYMPPTAVAFRFLLPRLQFTVRKTFCDPVYTVYRLFNYLTKTIVNLLTCKALFFSIPLRKYAGLELIAWLTNGLRPTVWKTPALRILADLERR